MDNPGPVLCDLVSLCSTSVHVPLVLHNFTHEEPERLVCCNKNMGWADDV